MAAKQIKDERQWNERCWATLQMFEFLNEAFGAKQFESNVRFKSEKRTRKMIGSFRMWIDLERLYLLSFLKMDSIEFQKDRIYFALFRMMNFLVELLMEYPMGDFKFEYLSKVSSQVGYLAQKLQKSLPDDMLSLVKCIAQILPNFLLKKEHLVDIKQRDEIKKVAYKKISRQYDMIPQVQQRLNTNIRVKSKQQEIRQIQFITKSQQISQMLKGVQPLYDLVSKANTQYDKKYPNDATNEEKRKQFVRNYINEIKQRQKQKQRDKGNRESIYQCLMRVGHNPYEQSNYAMYGQILGININKKKDFQNLQIQQQTQEQPQKQNNIYNQPQYIPKIQKMEINSVAVTQHDLNSEFFKKRKMNHLFSDNVTLFRNLNWEKRKIYQNNDTRNQYDQTDVNQINLKKKLQHNALFMKDEEQESTKKQANRKYQSNILNEMEKKKKKVWDYMENQKRFNIQTSSVVDKDMFDSLRKVAQFHAINIKIEKQVKRTNVPSFYPRGIDQIRKYYVDSSLKTEKIERAIKNINILN